MHSENEFDAILLTFCCYGHDANASEAVIAALMKKQFYQKVFFCQFVGRKVMGLVPKYYLLAGDTSQVSTFFLTTDKNY